MQESTTALRVKVVLDDPSTTRLTLWGCWLAIYDYRTGLGSWHWIPDMKLCEIEKMCLTEKI